MSQMFEAGLRCRTGETIFSNILGRLTSNPGNGPRTKGAQVSPTAGSHHLPIFYMQLYHKVDNIVWFKYGANLCT